ncbi:hypothetical protein CUC50_22095 [Citrobacter werkmanii]|nr:hypothetical protein CUC50_22095 [Citrobacter werkmanii]
MKKAHTLPHQSFVVICCVVNCYTFRRLDVKMTEKHAGVNTKIIVKGEEYSVNVKKIHINLKDRGIGSQPSATTATLLRSQAALPVPRGYVMRNR